MGKAFNVANEYVSNWTLMKIEGLKSDTMKQTILANKTVKRA